MIKAIVVLLALVVMMSSSVYAGPMIYGMGNNTCGHYVKVLEGYHQNNANDTRDYFGLMCWFQGFATNQSVQSGEDILSGRDLDSLQILLEKFCKEHPSDLFYTASRKLLDTLKKK